MNAARVFLFSPALMVVVAMSLGAAGLVAQDDLTPEEVYRKCTQHLEHLTRRCVSANVDTAEACVPRIRHLIDTGHPGMARELAARCISHVETQTHHCLVAMEELCHHCVHTLRRLGAHELAARFVEQCRVAREHVVDSAKQSIRAIQEALGDHG